MYAISTHMNSGYHAASHLVSTLRQIWALSSRFELSVTRNFCPLIRQIIQRSQLDATGAMTMTSSIAYRNSVRWLSSD